MKKILLMGNPNVGKSAVFSRLTGIHVIASNYPGTTVEFTQGTMKIGDEEAILIDVPGTYGLEATSKAEKIAVEMLKDGDAVINVVDATNLERNLHLTLHLLERNIPVIIALNIWDDAKHKGITIDVKKMEELLGVPVVPTVAVTGEGIKELVSRIPQACNPKVARRSEEEKWTEAGRILDKVQLLQHRHHTLLEVIGDASVKPLSGIPIAILVMFAAFKVIRFIGEWLIGNVFEPIFERFWQPLMMQLSSILDPGSFLRSIIIGKLIDGEIDFVQSFGVLTTGLFVPIGMVLPYIFSFYIVLGVMEDSGYLPRLAVLLDNLMHRMGLHGWAIIPTLLGLGCNVPGIMATRILESRRERLITATIISIGVPCAALQAMIWGLVGEHGGRYVAIIYLSLFVVWVVLGRILNMILKGESQGLIMEVPPYRMPSLQTVVKKLWMRMAAFLKEALPIVLLGIMVVNILYFLKIFDVLADFAAPLITNVFGLPKEAVIAMAIGFLRKDVAVGMLGTLDLTAKQLVVAATALAMSFPCIATFVVLFKELGITDTLKSVLAMLISSLIVGGLLNAIL
ncbi:MAG: ferrous iron transporter B [Candidatus Aureabacteria bacterium]|nr:ferrous iron transporter B [Candidatus Auribacterota bacterium]